MANSLFIKADEVAELLGVSRAEAYRIIKRLNDQLSSRGFIVVNGRVNRKYLGQHRTNASADLSGSFAPVLQFQKWEIHTVFPHFWNFEPAQNLSLSFLAELCGVALEEQIYGFCNDHQQGGK